MKALLVALCLLGGAALVLTLVKRGGRASEALSASHAVERVEGEAQSLTTPSVLSGSSAPGPGREVAVEPEAPEAPVSVLESLRALRSKIEEPLLGVDLEAALAERYKDFEPVDMLQVYPILLSAQDRAIRESLRQGIDSGNYLSEFVEPGQPVNLGKYKQSGEIFNTVAHEVEPLGNGLIEYRIVPIDRNQHPLAYARTYEEIWVHERIDDAGICPYCATEGTVKVTTKNR